MSTEPDQPADTRMMRIVHQAIQRDLERAHAALTSVPAPPQRQQDAIARHLTWMMTFVRAHHYSEDEGLYPLVRARSARAAALLDTMRTDHEAIAASIVDVETAAEAFGYGDRGHHLDELVRSVDQLAVVLLPHLQREENETMPLVSSVITNDE